MAPMSVLPYCLPYMVPLMTVWSHYSALPFISLFPMCFVWVIVPALDYLVGELRAQSPPQSREARRELENRIEFRLIVYFWCPIQLALLVWSAIRVSDPSLTALQCISLTLTMGLVAAEGVNCSHELLHRRSAFERAIGELLLVSVCYGHFNIEHNFGHHKRVATPHDPATLRFGESFYSFLPRTIIGGYASAWSIEADRLSAAGRPLLSLHNKMLRYAVSSLLIALGLHFGIGPRATIVFFVQSLVAIMHLEQINAIEHYGLSRSKMKNGEFEPVGAEHSWDTTHLLSNFILFKLQNHADHHLHALRRYQALEVSDNSPKLPAGYLTLAPLLFIPPLWRAVMDPVLMAHIDAKGKEKKNKVGSQSKRR